MLFDEKHRQQGDRVTRSCSLLACVSCPSGARSICNGSRPRPRPALPSVFVIVQAFLGSEEIFIVFVLCQAMEMAARQGPGVEVLHAILPGVDDRNAEVSSKVR